MSNDNGGPAFPVQELNADGSPATLTLGMSLRDYFIAHAPAEPQPWFKPAMPPCPLLPHRDFTPTEDEKRELEGYQDWLGLENIQSARVRDFLVKRDDAALAQDKWHKERDRQRYIQWPAAWADAMLAERGRQQ